MKPSPFSLPMCFLTWPRFGRRAAALILGLALASPASFAANQYFSNAGGPKPWDTTTANWSAATGGPYTSLWTSGNTAIFEGTAGTVNVGSGAGAPTCGGMTFNASGYTLSGGGINLANGSSMTIPSSTTATISSALADASGGSSLTAYGASGSSSILNLNGPNTFTGTLSVRQCVVNFNTLATGGNPGSFGAGSSSTAVIVGTTSGFSSIRHTGAGGSTDRPVTVNGTATGNSIQNNGTGAIHFNNTASAVGGSAGARYLTLSGSYTAAANTFAGQLADMTGFTTALTVSGNTWNITGNNNHSGGTTLGTSGVLNIGHANALGTGTFTVSGNGSFDNATGGDIAVANAFTLSGGSPTYVGSANSMTINGAVTLSTASRIITVSARTLALGGAIGEDAGGRSLTAAGTGTLALFGVNTYSGGTVISSTGTLLITNDTALGSSSAGLTFSGSGILAATNNGAAANNPVTIGSARTITVNSGKTANFYTPDTNDLILAAKITGAGGVKRFAAGSSYALGSVRFSNNNNDYTGEFTAAQGHTEFTSVANAGTASSLGKGTTGTITIANNNSTGYLTYVGSANSSTTRPLNWTSVGSYSLENNGSGTIAWLSSGSLRSSDTRVAILTLAGANTGTNTLAQVINDNTGETALTKGGVGRWLLTGVNTYSGNTTISAGTLALSGSGSIANTPRITVAGGATFDVSGLSSPPFALGAGQSLANSGASTANLNGNISTGSGSAALTYASGTPSFTTAGTLSLDAGTTLTVTNTGSQLGHGSHKLISKIGSGSVTGTLPASYSVLGGGAASPNYLSLSGGELYLTVNNAPSAQAITMGARAGVLTSLQIIGGKQAPTDNDGDALTLQSVSNPSANGGTVAINGNHVEYTALSSFSGTDTFDYTVSDGFGGTDTKTVTVTVTSANAASLNVVFGPTVVGGDFVVRFAGVPGTVYTVETNGSLGGPGWAKLDNYTAPTTEDAHPYGVGIFQVTKTNEGEPSLYFRTIHPSY